MTSGLWLACHQPVCRNHALPQHHATLRRCTEAPCICNNILYTAACRPQQSTRYGELNADGGLYAATLTGLACAQGRCVQEHLHEQPGHAAFCKPRTISQHASQMSANTRNSRPNQHAACITASLLHTTCRLHYLVCRPTTCTYHLPGCLQQRPRQHSKYCCLPVFVHDSSADCCHQEHLSCNKLDLHPTQLILRSHWQALLEWWAATHDDPSCQPYR
jgi:hypothetical protein